MALDFSDRTYANILAEQLERVPNTVDKRELSIIQTALGPESWTIEGIYLHLNQLQASGFALTAKGEALDNKAEERGIYRNPATAAHRRGEFNVEVPVGARFQTIDGAKSVVFSVLRSITSTNEYYHYEMVCETVGNIGNEYTGSMLPITVVAGLTYAQLTEILTAGTDIEDDDSLLQRYLLSLEEQAFAGNITAYENYVLSQPDTGAVQVYPHYPQGGYVLLSVIDSNFDIAGSGLINRLQLDICPPDVDQDNPSANGYGVAPIGAIVTVVTPTELPINVTMTVQTQSGVTISEVQQAIIDAVSAYLLDVRRSFGTRVISNKVEYPITVYLSRIVVNVLGVEGVANVTDVTINGDAADLELTETGALQELPVLGTVTING